MELQDMRKQQLKGLIAGINAALSLKNMEPFILG